MAEPPPPPSFPARLLGSGARGVGRVAGATGIDRAIEEAVADGIVRAVESPAFERAVAEILEGPAVERAMEQAMQSPAVERALAEAIDSEMIDRVWERLLASDEAQKLVERIAEAPEVRAAIAQQGVGLIGDLGREIGEVARKVDDILERIVRRLTFRKQRSEPTERAGGFTRLLALAIDAGILNLAVFGTSAIIAFVVNAVFPDAGDPASPVVLLGAGAWLAAAAIYLAGFWTFEGETPGMRFIGLNLEASRYDRLGLRRSIKRLLWLGLSIFPLLGIPLLGVARRDDRTGLHDRSAGTAVVYVDRHARAAPWSVEGRAKRGSAARSRPASRPEKPAQPKGAGHL
ncbi:MAG: RDD family protein [Solirubrobacterales bacterium]